MTQRGGVTTAGFVQHGYSVYFTYNTYLQYDMHNFVNFRVFKTFQLFTCDANAEVYLSTQPISASIWPFVKI